MPISWELPNLALKHARMDARSRGTVVFFLALMVSPLGRAQAVPAAPAGLDAGPADLKIAAAMQDVSVSKIQANIEKLASFQTRSTLSPQDAAAVASGRGIGAAREWIKSEFERYSHDCGGCLEVKTDTFQYGPADRIPRPVQVTNVYAILRGTSGDDQQRAVLVTGHYDSRNSDVLDATGAAPGANDDASGTAVSLECARVLSKLRFPATIIFLTVAGEEQGLIGSSHFAQMARAAGWNIIAVLNDDIVGGDRSPGQSGSVVRVFSEGIPSAATDADLHRMRNLGGENDSPSRQLARYIAQVARSYAIDLKPVLVFRSDRYLRGGDQSSFNELGIAAVRFTEFRENYDHQHQNLRTENGIEYGDLPGFVNFDYVADVARLNAAALASLASAPAPPPDVHLLTKELQNDSTLTWGTSSGASAYEVLWRDTTSPEWEHVKLAGKITRITLPLSKDNVIFAVRAVNPAGFRSIPVVPQPEH